MKKIKFTIALMLFLAASLISFAAPITIDQAKQKAQNFWQQKGLRSNVDFVNVTPQGQYAGFYILNASDGNGFVIVSSDTRTLPILGYSTKGSFDVAHMPDVVRYWLNAYEQEIEFLCQNADESESLLPETYARSSKNALSVDALMSTTWDQGKYYNQLCPVYNSNGQYFGGHVCTGCTNTAMAQVMKYWNWPPRGVGNASYDWTGNEWCDWTYGTLSADFENTLYDWNNMPNELTASSSQAQIDAVSTLIYHCGVANQSFYNDGGEGETGAYVTVIDLESDISYYGAENVPTYCAETSLTTFFRYKNTIQGLSKDDYSSSTWVEMLKTELDAGRPVIYQGYTSEWEAYGHCFVLDGYDTQDHFHVNWGWSGDYDGYFSLSSLRPYSYYNYNTYQEGLFYVEPDTSNVGVATLLNDNMSVQGGIGQIRVFGAEGQAVMVYDLQGRLVTQCSHAEQGETLPIRTPGLYIVRVGKNAKKVVVK